MRKLLVTLLAAALLVLPFAAIAEEYTGSAQGFGSAVATTVTIEAGKVVALTVDDSAETYSLIGVQREDSVGKLIDGRGRCCIEQHRGGILAGGELCSHSLFDGFTDCGCQQDDLIAARKMSPNFFPFDDAGRVSLDFLPLAIIVIDLPDTAWCSQQTGFLTGVSDFCFVKILRFHQSCIAPGFLGIYAQQGRIIDRHAAHFLKFFKNVSRETLAFRSFHIIIYSR